METEKSGCGYKAEEVLCEEFSNLIVAVSYKTK
jgi:hypothetical protein